MWLTPGWSSGRKNSAPKLFMMVELNVGILQPTVGPDPIHDGVQPDILHRGRAVMACRRNKLQEVMDATWNVNSMVRRSGEMVEALHKRKSDFCCVQETRWKGGSTKVLGAIGRRYKLF